MQVSWYSIFGPLMCVYLLVGMKDRRLRFALALLGLSMASRVILALAHASVATQTMNAHVMGVADCVVYVGLCVYLLCWFRARIRLV